MSANYITMTILGLASIISFGYLLYSLKQKNKDKRLGELISRETILNFEFIAEIILIFLFLSEAMTASTVVTGGQEEGFAIASFLRHTTISAVGAACNIVLVKIIAGTFKMGKGHYGYYINNAALSILLAIVALYVPFMNVEIIASNLSQSYEFEEWLYKLTYSEGAYNTYLIKHNYPETRNVFAEFQTVLKASVYQGILHIVLAFILGLFATSTKERMKVLLEEIKEEEKKKEGDKKEEKKPEEGDKEKRFKELIEYLLKRVGYKEDDKIKNIVNQAAKKVAGLNSNEQGIITTNLGKLKLAALNIDKEKDEAKKKSKNNELKKEIREFFANPTDHAEPDKRGLKIQLGNGGN